jgi:hypothetical protein
MMPARQGKKSRRNTRRQNRATGREAEFGRRVAGPRRRNLRDDYGAKLLAMKGTVADDVAL